MLLPLKITDDFPYLEEIDVEKLTLWLGKKTDPRVLQNQFANLLLYPQVIPVSQEEMNFQLVVLREVLRGKQNFFYNLNSKKLIIPEKLLNRFPNLLNLTKVFLDIFSLGEITTIQLQQEQISLRSLGTVITPLVLNSGLINLEVNEKKYVAKTDSLVQVLAPQDKIDIKLTSDSATFFGHSSYFAEVVGGELGIILDTRRKK